MTWLLEISIGPVQSFVQQSRRTRDLWGSSYLLSFLAAHTLKGASEAGAEVLRPHVEGDPLFEWVMGRGTGFPPTIGSIPNHLVLSTTDEPSTVAQTAFTGFHKAWQRIADAVWDRYLAPVAHLGLKSREIWLRQTASYWELLWAADELVPQTEGFYTRPHGSQPLGEGLRPLARRKLWRFRPLPDEPGDKCTVMYEWQELSGYTAAKGRPEREKQAGFWQTIRDQVGLRELRDDERLCAIAFIKRFYPLIAKDALGWDLDVSHWPSTVHLGTGLWVREVTARAPHEGRLLTALLEEVDASERSMPSISGRSKVSENDAKSLLHCDPNWLYLSFVRNERRHKIRSGLSDALLQSLEQRLLRLYNWAESGARPIGPPSSFFAILLADGDRMGQLVGQLPAEELSEGLVRFTKEVPQIVARHHGVTVYAGGDDVLAMLPLCTALPCAADIRSCYREIFRRLGDEASLSASVVFAPIRFPLASVLRQAHDLLHNVAKEANGRNSVAIGVLKRSGLHSQWVTTWERSWPGTKERHEALQLLSRLVQALDGRNTEPFLSNSFIHRLRSLLARLGDTAYECPPTGSALRRTVATGADLNLAPGTWVVMPSQLDLSAIVAAELKSGLEKRESEETDGEDQVGSWASLISHLLVRSTGGGEYQLHLEPSVVGLDVLIIAHFLATGGREEDHQ